jgi:tetratricopeptide (TPR) repeat protein
MTDFDRLWNYDDPAGTELKFRALRHQLAADHGRLLGLDTQIARALGLQGRFDEALAVLAGVRAALRPTEARAEIRYLLEMGRVLRSAGKPDAARPHFEQAGQQAQRAGEDALCIDAVHMLALVEADPERRLWHDMHALRIAEASADLTARNWRASLLHNIGMTQQELGDLDAALAAFEQALELRLPTGIAARIDIARWTVGWVLRLQGRLAEAMLIQQRLEQSYAIRGAPDGYVCEELGEIHLALGDSGVARNYLGRAYDKLKHDLAGSERLARMKALAER